MEVTSWTLQFLVTLVYYTIAKADDCCSYGVETDYVGQKSPLSLVTFMAEWEPGASPVLDRRVPRVVLKVTSTLSTVDGSAVVVLRQFGRLSADSIFEETYPYTPLVDGVCPPFSERECVDLAGSRNTGVSLQSVNVIYDEECQRHEASIGERNCRKRANWSYIALDISYMITFTDGSNFQGIIFGLRTSSGAVSETVGSVNEMCQYVTLNDTLGEEEAGGKIFHFTGFVGLHPGATYEVTASLLCNDVSVSDTVRIPFCDDKNTPVKKDDYFCNNDPASFLPKVGIHPNLSAWWTVYPRDDGPFTHFVADLVRHGSTEVIERATVFYNQSQYNGKDWIMTHQFSRRPPGEYEVWIYGQPDEGCRKGLHWKYCRGVICDVTAAYPDPITTSVPKSENTNNTSPVEPVTEVSTTTPPHVPVPENTSTTPPFGPVHEDTSIPPPFAEFMIITVSLLVTVMVLVCFSVVWLVKFTRPDETAFDFSEVGSIQFGPVNDEIVEKSSKPLPLLKEETWQNQYDDGESQNRVPFLQQSPPVTSRDDLCSR